MPPPPHNTTNDGHWPRSTDSWHWEHSAVIDSMYMLIITLLTCRFEEIFLKVNITLVSLSEGWRGSTFMLVFLYYRTDGNISEKNS